MSKRNFLIGVRLFFGLVTLAAIGTQLILHVQSGFNVVNFFSYFTNLSNIFAAVVMIVAAISLLRHRQPTATDDIIRGTSVVCMALVGIIFSVLLRGADLGALLPWVNILTHYVMPIVVVLDWLYQPPQSNLAVKQDSLLADLPAALPGLFDYPRHNRGILCIPIL